MVYWLLFKRSFRSFPSFFIANFVAIIATAIMFLVLIFTKSASRFFSSLSIVMVPLFWGLIFNPTRIVICRKSTLMIPDFRRINADFYIFSGFFVFLFLLSTISLFAGIMAGEPMQFFFISLGFGLFIYGLLLFLAHFLGAFIFMAFFLISGLQSYYKQIAQIFIGLPNRPLAVLFFILGVILIFLYRRAMVHLTEESAFFRHQARYFSFSTAWNTAAAAKQIKLYYSKDGFWRNGHRFTFEFFLNLLDRWNAPRKTKTFALSILKNYMDILSFTSAACWIIAIFFVIAGMGVVYNCTSSSEMLHFWWMWIIMMMFVFFSTNKSVKQDAARPINRNRLLLTDYTGTYLAAAVMTVVIWIGVKLGMLVVSSATRSVPLFPGILVAFLIVSFLLVVRRFIKNPRVSPVIFISIIMFSMVISSYRRPVIFQNIIRFSSTALYLAALVLTALFSIIAFRLDLKRDIN